MLNYRPLHILVVCTSLLCMHLWTAAQALPEFDMSDTTITVCDGILYDSGGVDEIYGVNEVITTVINTGGVITLTFFNDFCYENNLDFLYVYDGPDTSAPLLGVFTGSTLPPVLVANSGSVTIVSTSDTSVSYCGFAFEWDTDLPEPIPPVISVDTPPVCNSNTVMVNFSYNVACWWLDLDEFVVALESSGNTIDVIDINYPCISDSASFVQLELATPVNINCPYTVNMILPVADDCGLIYLFPLTTTFDMFNCPIDAQITANPETICPGSCTTLSVDVQGCYDYSFVWNNGIPPGPGPHNICPATTTSYSVTVTEIQSGNTVVLSQTIAVESASILTPDFSICQSADPVLLQADADGLWSGPGLLDETQGWFEPDSANAGLNTIYFGTENCLDSMYITIAPIATDGMIAACTGSDPFQLNANPAGGTWTGPFTTADGIFDPSAEGSYSLTYSLGGCTDALIVNVDSISGTYFLDTLCQSIWQDTLLFSPPGGSWSGPGIADTTLGIFVPLDAPPGDVQLLYSIVGCDQVFTAHVLEIYVDYSHSACPQEDPLIWNDPPSPTGGYWEGDGIIDPVTGLYDPSLFLNDTYTEIIYYAPNGCSDTTFIHNLQTVIATESISFCLSDEPFQLYDENVGNAPGNNGTWSGPGVEEWWDDGWFITPALAGVGEFMVYFDKNNCTDSMQVRVFPDGISASDYLVCSDAEPFQLDPFVMDGAWWTGPGITDSTGGWFDPSLAPEGLSTCYWNTSAGCLDSVLVTVEYFQQATIAGLNPEYCFADTNLVLDVIPPGGVVSGDLDDVSFNPAVMGEGNYEVIYTWNGAVCTSADTSQFVVFPPIITSVNATDSVICLGESVLITVDASGGHPLLPLQYLWDDGSLPINTHQVSPDITTTYIVTTFDGCTDPAVDTVTVIVLPPILTDVVTSDTVCFGEPGFASAVVLNTGEFSVIWDEVSEDIIESTAGTAHSLLISDLENGCAFDSLVLIPSWSPLTAAFSINPNEDCIAWDEAGSISFIDLSQHAITGTWYFGDNATQTYIQGENPSYSFEQAGQFEVVLVAFNEGNCVDSAFAEVCILPPTPVFIPDIFSPNGDGNNDVFYVRSQGILSMEFVIYNRWGEQVFFSDHPAKGWDGQYRGEPGVADTYMYFLRARMNDGSEYEAKGELLLTR